MQANHQNTTRIAAQLQARIGRTEQIHQLVVDDLDNLLAGLDARNDLLPDGFGLDSLDEIPGNLEIHIRFEQSHPHLAQRFPDVVLGDFSEATQVLESVLQFAA